MNKKYKNIVSCISPVYNSHPIVREHILYLNKELKGLDEYVEIIFIDDGSEPSLVEFINNIITEICLEKINEENKKFTNFYVDRIEEKIPWNQLNASNLGAKKAKGTYLLFFDIDHIITRKVVEELLYFENGMLHWKRMHGVLENGELKTDDKTLTKYLVEDEIRRIPFSVSNTFAIKKDIFSKIGGYPKNMGGYYNFGDDILRKNYRAEYGRGNLGKSLLYVYPDAKKHKHLFHNLVRVKDDKDFKNIKP